MYRVSYYTGGNHTVTFKEFATFGEATKFSVSLPIYAVLEIKFYPDVDNKKPDRN